MQTKKCECSKERFKKKCKECDELQLIFKLRGKALSIVRKYQEEIATKKNTAIKNVSKSRVIEIILCNSPDLNIQKVGETGIVISK